MVIAVPVTDVPATPAATKGAQRSQAMLASVSPLLHGIGVKLVVDPERNQILAATRPRAADGDLTV